MKLANYEDQLVMNHIIAELNNRFGYFDTEGKSLRELKHKLATLRATEVVVNSPHSGWF